MADVKPRSHDVTTGMQKAPARAMLRARRDDGRRLGQAPGRGGLELERDHPLQPLAPPPGPASQGRNRVGRGLSSAVQHHLGLRRHLDGARGHAGLVGVAGGHRRQRGDGDARGAARRLRRPGRLRQEPARDAHGRGPARPADGLRLRRNDPAWPPQRPGTGHHQRLRGGRCLRGRDHHRGRARRHRAQGLSWRGRLRRHVHGQHDGRDR